jgi:hypothetical protein
MGAMMRKIIALLLSTGMLVGCAATSEESASTASPSAEIAEEIQEDSPDSQDSGGSDSEVSEAETDEGESKSEESTSTMTPSADAQSSATERVSMFEQGCASLANGSLTHKYLEKYRPIVEDICDGFEMDYSLVEVVTSPLVDQDSVKLYVQNNVFGLSYWDRYVAGGLQPMKMLLLMEDEEDWWSNELSGLVAVTPEWFGPTDGGGHCYAAEAEAFCPKGYYAHDGETTGNFNVLTTMLGSKLDWNTFRKVVPIHESTHQFHSTTGLGHWRWWYIEGQATYFELAATVLVPDLGASDWRDEIGRDTYRQDELKFKASNVSETVAYMDECDNTGKCNGFRYFGASLAHELLVNTYGIETYLNWNLALAERLPDFFWRGMDEETGRLGRMQFEDIFEEFFGIDIDTWEQTEFASLVLETYNCEVKGIACS